MASDDGHDNVVPKVSMSVFVCCVQLAQNNKLGRLLQLLLLKQCYHKGTTTMCYDDVILRDHNTTPRHTAAVLVGRWVALTCQQS